MKGNTRLKHENIGRVLEEIRSRAPITKRELQDITGFSWGNISTIVNELQERGYIVSVGKQETLVGRRSDQYDISPNENLIIGVDLNMNGILLVVTSIRGQIVYRQREFYRERERQCVLDTLYEMIDKAIATVGAASLRRIAIGLQGYVDTKNGVSVDIYAIRNWRNIPLVKLVEERYDISCILIHDPDCVMRAEMNRGWLYRDSADTALLLRLEKYEVGMSVIMNGQLRAGVHERASNVGRVLLPYDNQVGWISVDDLLPESNMAKLYGNMFPEEKERITYDLLAEQVKVKNQKAMRFQQKWVLALGILLMNMATLFEPEKVIIYGEMLQYQDIYKELLSDLLRERFAGSVKLLFSKQNMDAAAVGAALWGADNWMRGIVF